MERNNVITTLEVLRTNCSKHSRDYQALDYAISSLKTDEAYQIMYEGGEMFTKDEVIVMITGIINEIDEEAWKQGCNSNYDREDEAYYISNLIQQKINKLKEQTDGKSD